MPAHPAQQANPFGARRRGRPPGSKNKPKLNPVDPETEKSLRDTLGSYLPADDLTYLLGTLEGKINPELSKDVDIFLALQLKALLPILAEEIQNKQLSREATSRSGTVKELLAIRLQMEKMKAGTDGDSAGTFIQNVFLSRGIDPARLAVLTGTATEVVPKRISGSTDGDEQESDEVGGLSDQPSERLLEVSSGGQE